MMPEVVADQRTGHHQQRHPKEQVHQKGLPCGSAAADRRARNKSRADPGQADPDDRRLDMDIAQEIEGQEAIDLKAVEAGAIRIIVSQDRPREDLQQQQTGDDQKVLADRPWLASADGTGQAPDPSALDPGHSDSAHK